MYGEPAQCAHATGENTIKFTQSYALIIFVEVLNRILGHEVSSLRGLEVSQCEDFKSRGILQILSNEETHAKPQECAKLNRKSF
jgi:hypothetical protein